MTADALSDLVLALVCAGIAARCLGGARSRPGIGIAAVLIGLAAVLGVLRFSTWAPFNEAVRGAHQFASLVAAVGGFPLLAFSLHQPDSPLATRLAGAWWLVFVVAGAGVAAVVLGVKVWARVAPLLSCIWIGHAVFFKRAGAHRAVGGAGLAFLLAAVAATLLMARPEQQLLGLFTRVQLLHYLMAVALWLLARAPRADAAAVVVPAR
jgi:hypothetical protein